MDDLTRAVTRRLRSAGYQGVAVDCRDGVAALAGTLLHWEAVVEAGHIAAETPGVRSVYSELTCPGVDLPKLPAARRLPQSPLCREPWDVVVVGAGVTGCSVARELARYDLRVIVVEAGDDVAGGATRANNGTVHCGLDPLPGSLKAKLNVQGNAMYPGLCAELGVSYRVPGLLGVVRSADELFLLDLVLARAAENRVPGVVALRGAEAVRSLEPALGGEIAGGFYSPTTGAVSPYGFTLACAEQAAANGVSFLLDTAVTGVAVHAGRVRGVRTERGLLEASWCVNAAGVWADLIAASAGCREFTIHPRLGEMFVFDVRARGHCRTIITPFGLAQDDYTKGGGAGPSACGNHIWGPTAVETWERVLTPTSRTGRAKVVAKFGELLPGADPADIIAAYAGLRAVTYTEDFHIAHARGAGGLVNVAGMQSPGLAAAPAVALEVIRLLGEGGLPLRLRRHYTPRPTSPPRFSELADGELLQALLRTDPAWGRVVCRCEQVTEAEVKAAMQGPLGARSVDAVKRRTRAGMGRCQGGFCGHRVAALLQERFGAVTKAGDGSPWLAGVISHGT